MTVRGQPLAGALIAQDFQRRSCETLPVAFKLEFAYGQSDLVNPARNLATQPRIASNYVRGGGRRRACMKPPCVQCDSNAVSNNAS